MCRLLSRAFVSHFNLRNPMRDFWWVLLLIWLLVCFFLSLLLFPLQVGRQTSYTQLSSTRIVLHETTTTVFISVCYLLEKECTGNSESMSCPVLRLALIRKLRIAESNVFRTSVSLPPPGAVNMRLFGEPRTLDRKGDPVVPLYQIPMSWQ